MEATRAAALPKHKMQEGGSILPFFLGMLCLAICTVEFGQFGSSVIRGLFG